MGPPGSWSINSRHGPWPLLLVLLAVLLTSCTLPPVEVAQGGGFPTLRQLYWRYAYYENALWSSDGRWIAAMAGTDPANSHLVVLSPDGQTRQDLSSWGAATG
jgi:hypothetical protein